MILPVELMQKVIVCGRILGKNCIKEMNEVYLSQLPILLVTLVVTSSTFSVRLLLSTFSVRLLLSIFSVMLFHHSSRAHPGRGVQPGGAVHWSLAFPPMTRSCNVP